MADRPKPKPKPARTAEGVSQSIGRAKPKSRAQAETNVKRHEEQVGEPVPLTPDGRPMTMIEMAASELIPTGQFANISVGPAKIRHWIDAEDPEPISQEALENIAKGLNRLAEVVEVDVIAVQRNLVLESMQSQISGENGEK